MGFSCVINLFSLISERGILKLIGFTYIKFTTKERKNEYFEKVRKSNSCRHMHVYYHVCNVQAVHEQRKMVARCNHMEHHMVCWTFFSQMFHRRRKEKSRHASCFQCWSNFYCTCNLCIHLWNNTGFAQLGRNGCKGNATIWFGNLCKLKVKYSKNTRYLRGSVCFFIQSCMLCKNMLKYYGKHFTSIA